MIPVYGSQLDVVKGIDLHQQRLFQIIKRFHINDQIIKT